ncbi:hypothetical protein BGZ63DRAFT_150363 [Mariannaea sp. PMI_226]|nr:hypothetical protein BGZ63DRAFT_150363 [Mariannaea sp. PMI_226]
MQSKDSSSGKNNNKRASLDEATREDIRRMTASLLDQTTIEQLSRAGMAAKLRREMFQEARLKVHQHAKEEEAESSKERAMQVKGDDKSEVGIGGDEMKTGDDQDHGNNNPAAGSTEADLASDIDKKDADPEAAFLEEDSKNASNGQ